MNPIKSFFAKIRYKMFVFRIEWEIFGRIFSHLQHECDAGYPFHSHEEIEQLCQNSPVAPLPFVKQIERDIRRMPKGYSRAFRYILYRDLENHPQMSNMRMRMYQLLAQRRVYRKCDPRFVARRAT